VDSAVLLRLRGTRAQHTLGSAAIGSQWVQPLRHGDPIADVWNTRAQPTPIASSPGGGAARGGEVVYAAGTARTCPPWGSTGPTRSRRWPPPPPPPPPIDAPCTRCLRHGDPMHDQERLTASAAAACWGRLDSARGPSCVLPSLRRGGGGGRAAAAAAVILGSPPLPSAPQRQGTAIIHRDACIIQVRRLIDARCPPFAKPRRLNNHHRLTQPNGSRTLHTMHPAAAAGERSSPSSSCVITISRAAEPSYLGHHR
jgi:hypothetical protein